ncbi:hypothetical protein DM867_04340 [Halosegnis rubeus]|jgi:rRNA maturation endonuclease Nob1|uniref:Uncharacterized protein n=1 Tax=Halosegnis rubeus TaxID=2212850 RepID=A0A5N5U9K1_9EURY|nr:hypothetical protein [Halosegnis rubeus]KAB7515305.1 hypothetical protein DMP03_08720 [Halosegnis rubeus]KAB7516359.1 hypothetical protein DM867_04340 [Halosegnis rubeus]
MGLSSTAKEVLKASTQSPNRGESSEEVSDGSYWCYDCSERIRDLDQEGEETPECPSCGDAMEFERSATTTGCAC